MRHGVNVLLGSCGDMYRGLLLFKWSTPQATLMPTVSARKRWSPTPRWPSRHCAFYTSRMRDCVYVLALELCLIVFICACTCSIAFGVVRVLVCTRSRSKCVTKCRVFNTVAPPHNCAFRTCIHPSMHTIIYSPSLSLHPSLLLLLSQRGLSKDDIQATVIAAEREAKAAAKRADARREAALEQSQKVVMLFLSCLWLCRLCHRILLVALLFCLHHELTYTHTHTHTHTHLSSCTGT